MDGQGGPVGGFSTDMGAQSSSLFSLPTLPKMPVFTTNGAPSSMMPSAPMGMAAGMGSYHMDHSNGALAHSGFMNGQGLPPSAFHASLRDDNAPHTAHDVAASFLQGDRFLGE
jgi:hypothetical protein